MPCELVRRHIRTCSSKFYVKMENLDVGDYNISKTIITTETWVAPFGSVTLPLCHSQNETRISLTVSEIFDRKQEPWTRYFFILIIISRANSFVRVLSFQRLTGQHSKNMMLTTLYLRNDNNYRDEVCTVGSTTFALGYSKNGTRISLTVSEIFDAKDNNLARCFFIMPCELVRRHIPSCSSKFDVKMENLEILDVGDYNISETITTTETRVAPFGSVTLPVGQSENGIWISLTVLEIFDRKHIALNAIFLYSYYYYAVRTRSTAYTNLLE